MVSIRGRYNSIRRWFRNWRVETDWEFRPLREHTALYRIWVVVGIPLLTAATLVLAAYAGLDLGVDSPSMVAVAIVASVWTSTLIFKTDSQSTTNVGAAIPLCLVLAGEVTGAIVVALLASFAYALRTPLMLHDIFSVNSLGCGVWVTTVTALVFQVSGGAQPVLSEAWMVAALLAGVTYSAADALPLHVSNWLGRYATAREALSDAWEGTRSGALTLAPMAALAGAAMSTGTWWFILFAGAPVLISLETLIRTDQVVEARNDAERDALTGLFNRRALEERLDAAISSISQQGARREDRHGVWILMCDLDNFKQLNDSLGHAAGDDALVTAASVLRSSVRSTDVCARFGGEEMVVVLPQTPAKDALMVAERICRETYKQLHSLGTSFSIGIYRIQPGDDAAKGLHNADVAMYHSKTRGKNQVTVWSEHLLDQPGVDSSKVESESESAA